MSTKTKKAPRKPRPSEIAAKKAKAAAKKNAKPKAKRPAGKKPFSIKGRPERIDMRVTKEQKAGVIAKAKKLHRTVTSIVLEAIDRLTK